MSKYHSESFIRIISSEVLSSSGYVCPISNLDIKSCNLPPSLSCMYVNARSLNNKMELLQRYVELNKPYIIAITETWAKPDIPDGFYAIAGYKLFRQDRPYKRGGGIMVYIIETVGSSRMLSDSFCELDFITCKLHLSNNKYLGILCVYRPPNITDAGDMLIVDLMDKFLSLNLFYNVIVGDFNMPSVEWKKLSAPTKFMPFIKCCSKYFLKQHVKESTRPNSDAILDLILSTVGTNVKNVSVNECLGSSDHSILNFVLDLPSSLKVNDTIQRKRNYNKADWHRMNTLLNKVNWDEVFNSSNINDVWFNLKNVINESVQTSIPYKTRNAWRIKSSSRIRSALRYTRRCHSKYKALNTSESLLKLLHAKEHLQSLINNQTDSFEQNVVASLNVNPKVFWSYVNSKLCNKANTINMIKTNQRTLEDHYEIAEALNEHFHNCFNHNSTNLRAMTSAYATEIIPTLQNVKIDFYTVTRTIRSLPNKCSEDLNGFSYAILKGGGDTLAYQLTRCFQLSLLTESIPLIGRKVSSSL